MHWILFLWNKVTFHLLISIVIKRRTIACWIQSLFHRLHGNKQIIMNFLCVFNKPFWYAFDNAQVGNKASQLILSFPRMSNGRNNSHTSTFIFSHSLRQEISVRSKCAWWVCKLLSVLSAYFFKSRYLLGTQPGVYGFDKFRVCKAETMAYFRWHWYSKDSRGVPLSWYPSG